MMKFIIAVTLGCILSLVACSDKTKDNAVALGKSIGTDVVNTASDVGSAALDKGKELTHDAADAVSNATK